MEPIEIQILEETSEFVKVKLPFLEVPVEMNQSFLKKRLDSGYFQLPHKKLQATG